MALQDIEAELASEIPWRTCAVCHHLAERDEEWGKALRRLLGNKGIGFKKLEAHLAADPDEPSIPWDALSRHARAGCSAKEHLR
jgi:hypothetical protein